MSVISQALREIDARHATTAPSLSADALLRRYAQARIQREPAAREGAPPGGARGRTVSPAVLAASVLAAALAGAFGALSFSGSDEAESAVAVRGGEATSLAQGASPATPTVAPAPGGASASASAASATATPATPSVATGPARPEPRPATPATDPYVGLRGEPLVAGVPSAPSAPVESARAAMPPALERKPAVEPVPASAPPRDVPPQPRAIAAPAPSPLPEASAPPRPALAPQPARAAAASAPIATPAPAVPAVMPASTASTAPAATPASVAKVAKAVPAATPAPTATAAPAVTAAPTATAAVAATPAPAAEAGVPAIAPRAAAAPAVQAAAAPTRAVPAPPPVAAPSAAAPQVPAKPATTAPTPAAAAAVPPPAEGVAPATAQAPAVAVPAAAATALGVAAASTARATAPPRAATAALTDTPVLASPNASITVQPRPDGADALQARASAALAAGDVHEATRLLRAALAIEPGAHTSRQALLAILGRGERGAAWLDALAEAAVASPERFGLLAARGLADGGRMDAALAALAMVPAPLRGLEYLTTAGLLAQRAGKHGLAIDQLAEALGRTAPDAPSVPALRVAIADSLAARGDVAAAREQLEAVAGAPNARAEVRALARDRLQALAR